MEGHALALEIGCEEIPARFLDDAIAQLRERAAQRLAEARLGYRTLDAVGTPRRLILLAEGVAPRQEDQEVKVRGPAARVAFDAEGRPTPAALGFARSQGVAVEDLRVEETPQGPYIFAVRREEGRPAAEVLPELLARAIADLQFPRPMRWDDSGVAFIRPIRWLLALLDDQVLPVRYAGVTADRYTRGHRVLGPGPHPVPHARELLAVLERAGVLADHRARRQRVREEVEAAAAAAGGRARLEEGLLDELTHLVEWPTALAGSFDPVFLELPAEVLIKTMQHHQRMVPVVDEAGRLLPRFVAVRNGAGRGQEHVLRGNEKVLRARLADARFFYDEDRRRPLADYVPRLAGVVFQERLGSMLDKTRRLERLTAWLADALEVAADDRAAALRAAYLAKADLATHLVYELPELEGIMGREYARASGEPEAVARAIYEQHLPRPDDPSLPATVPGLLLALADRADTLAGSFAAGLEPTGSQDPYGLRRVGAALLQLLTAAPEVAGARGWELDAARLLAEALAGYGDAFGEAECQAALQRLLPFLQARLEGQLREAGIRYDVADGVLAAGWTRVAEAWARARAGMRLLASPLLDDVYTAFRRAYNLAGRHPEADPAAVDPAAFDRPEEAELHTALQAVEPEARALLAARDYDGFYARVARLRPVVDRFLDGVLVMADDPRLRRNRLALLRRVADLAAAPLDLSRLAVG